MAYAPTTTRSSADSDETPEVGSDCWSLEDMKIGFGLIADAVHEHVLLPGIELHHGGAQPPTESPATEARPEPGDLGVDVCRAGQDPTLADIRRIQTDFVTAARRARDVGFDIVVRAWAPTVDFRSPRCCLQ